MVQLGIVVTLIANILTAGSAGAGEVRSIIFPVEGRSNFRNDFGDPRPGGRTHQGNDIFAAKLQRVVAATDAQVGWMRTDASGTSGNMVSLIDEAGWQYWYMHINNDTPGTDDGLNPLHGAFIPGLRTGARVLAGQPIGYVGDSGNAEATSPHLHFEIHRPDGSVLNPYESLIAARRISPPVARGIAAHPGQGYYVLTDDGVVHAFDGAPLFGYPNFGWDIARAIAVMPDGEGYLILDGWGGVHKFGSATRGPISNLGNRYWAGWDIARSMAVTPSGEGYVILDGWGGQHAFGDSPTTTTGSYWPGWDIARSVAITPTGEGAYVLDGWGGVHTAGDAVGLPTPYWQGWDIARAVVAAPKDDGFAVLNGWGGVYPAGTARVPAATAWIPGVGEWIGLSLKGTRYFGVRHDGLSERW